MAPKGAKRRTEASTPTVPARTDAPAVLTCANVSVTFGGLQALSEVSLEVREGEIVGLIGPNGAGKTTLFECISGFQPYQRGRITYQGQDLADVPPEKRAWIGIG